MSCLFTWHLRYVQPFNIITGYKFTFILFSANYCRCKINLTEASVMREAGTLSGKPNTTHGHHSDILHLSISLFGKSSEVISRRCLLVAVVLWPMCCHTEMPCRRHRTWHPTPSQYTDEFSLCYPLMWNDTLEYTANHCNVLDKARPGNPSPTFHTHQRTLRLMLLRW